ncbi:hypothetical protein GN278_02905 [Rhodobacteraceae bacterium Araon29]
MLKIFFCLFILIVVMWGSQLTAGSFTCKVKDGGYAHSTNAAAGNLKKQLEIIKSWIPGEFVITPKSLTFSGWRAMDVSLGNRETTFTVFFTKERKTYRIKINPSESRGVVSMEAHGYKTAGPVFFYCENL